MESYRTFSGVNQRNGEPDLWLLVEWTPADVMRDATTQTIFGTEDAAQVAGIKREDVRALESQLLMQVVSVRDRAGVPGRLERATGRPLRDSCGNRLRSTTHDGAAG